MSRVSANSNADRQRHVITVQSSIGDFRNSYDPRTFNDNVPFCPMLSPENCASRVEHEPSDAGDTPDIPTVWENVSPR
jgi:hypothetical protein